MHLLAMQVRPFSELPQRPIHGMLNFWQTREGLHSIATDPTLQPPAPEVPDLIGKEEDPSVEIIDAAEPADQPLNPPGPEVDVDALPKEIAQLPVAQMVEAEA